MKRKKQPVERNVQSNLPEAPATNMVFIASIGRWVYMKRWVAMSLYYGIQIPQDICADTTISLFDDRIGEKEWTNFTRPRMLEVGHEGMIYKVSLAVKPTDETRIVDVVTALQFGDLTVKIGDVSLISEPLSFFPVTLYGEVAAREDDLLQRLAFEVDYTDIINAEQGDKLMAKLSGLPLPAMIGESERIDGHIDLSFKLYGRPEFVLYVILHTVVSVPLRDEDEAE